jgi:SET domain-containing protein
VRPGELPTSADLRVAQSLIPGAGLGVFARKSFAEGEVVCDYEGVQLSTLDALRTPDWRYLAGLGKTGEGRRIWIDAQPTPSLLARYINHHFDPAMRNIGTQPVPDEGRWVMRAARPIAQGEELYYDYGRFHLHCFDRGLLREHRRRTSSCTTESQPRARAVGDRGFGERVAARRSDGFRSDVASSGDE